MRLIDADAIKYTAVFTEYANATKSDAIVTAAEIDALPTICTGCGWASVATQDECEACKQYRKEEQDEPTE